MQQASRAVACRLPSILLMIAHRLGAPMRFTRCQVLAVGASRRFQLWEFQGLGDNAITKVIAVDVRDHRIADWKLLSESFEQAVLDYQDRIEERRRHCPAHSSSAAAA